MIRRAMQLAVDHGMRFHPVHSKAGVADIFCAVCGWPLVRRETVVEQYVREPYGCAPCAAAKRVESAR